MNFSSTKSLSEAQRKFRNLKNGELRDNLDMASETEKLRDILLMQEVKCDLIKWMKKQSVSISAINELMKILKPLSPEFKNPSMGSR